MNRDDIIRMALEAGGGTPEWDDFWEFHQDALERFAALVAAREREACAKICETGADCEHPTVKGHVMQNFGASTHLAQAIRARGEV